MGGRWATAGFGIAALLFALACLFRPSAALTLVPGPIVVSASHLGVGSCAGSTCHGRQEETGAVVRQDELRIWQDASSPAGAHSRAWQVLGQPRAQAIALRLGIGNPQAAPACLGCHSDGEGTGFHAADGVDCEACHGGAANWIASHTSVGATHAGNVAHGMRPLDQPAVRAGRCLDCHFGSARPGQFVDHRIMAAGHPRLSFELDLFSTLEKHWNEDADYGRRKAHPGAATLWAIGQAEALGRALTLYSDPLHGQEGAFPEFSFFDCQSCHRRISDQPDARPTAIANPSRGTPPGTVPFQDENMIMLSAATRVAAPDLARRLDGDSRSFHQALIQGRGASVAAAARLHATADALAERFAGGIGAGEARAMVAALADTVETPRYTDYEGSVQAVMAVDTLLSALTDDGAISREAVAAIRPDIDRAYAAVHDPNDYRPFAFRAALADATGAIAARR